MVWFYGSSALESTMEMEFCHLVLSLIIKTGAIHVLANKGIANQFLTLYKQRCNSHARNRPKRKI
jgi:hypothetical protein